MSLPAHFQGFWILSAIPVPPLKDAVAIDKFKGNADTGKYQCILVNPKHHTVMDILPDRTTSHLSAYFREMDRSQRYRVKFFICDMWQP